MYTTTERYAVTDWFDQDSPVVVAVIAVLAAIGAVLSGVSPTGQTVTDALVTAAVAGFVTWAGGQAPWWILGLVGGIAAACGDHRLWSLVALVGVAIALALGYFHIRSAALSALSAACAVQGLVHLKVNPYLGASALLAAVLGLAIVISGVDHRSALVRNRLRLGALAVFGFALLFTAAFGLSAYFAKDSISNGYDKLMEGLRQLRAGHTTEAAATLRSAASTLNDADGTVGGIWTQPARLLPFVAQHRNAVSNIVADAASSASAAAGALDAIDAEKLRVVNGAIDVTAISALAAPMHNLSAAVQQMSSTLDNADSPWLFAPFQQRLGKAKEKLAAAELQVRAGEAAGAYGPAMLGASGPRKYLVLFTSPGEARGQSGLIGNYAELTIDHGTLSRTGFGRTSQLIKGVRDNPKFSLVASPDYLRAYGPYGAVDRDGYVADSFWSNVTMSPDLPSAASAMAQMYAGAGFGTVDGVFVIDVYGLAALSQITGPVTVAGIAQPLTPETLQNFLLYDQYLQPENVRRDQLAAVADATMNLLLSSDLPVPEKLAHELGPAATEGHIVGWATRPEEQDLLVRVGMSGRLPEPDRTDGLAIVSNNAGGNKIDSFLERSETYSAEYNPATGEVDGVLEVVLKNNAPPDGYADDVIGSAVGVPKGTNRTLLTVYSPLQVQGVEVDGVSSDTIGGTELGWNTTTVMVDVGPGELSTVKFTIKGVVAPGKYQFLWRPQPLTRPDSLALSVRSTNGEAVATAAGQIKRLSLISVDGVSAVR